MSQEPSSSRWGLVAVLAIAGMILLWVPTVRTLIATILEGLK